MSADYKLPLPKEEVVGLRARITCQKSPRKSGPQQEAELSPWTFRWLKVNVCGYEKEAPREGNAASKLSDTETERRNLAAVF